jgi:hypothetical protein
MRPSYLPSFLLLEMLYRLRRVLNSLVLVPGRRWNHRQVVLPRRPRLHQKKREMNHRRCRRAGII